MALNLLSLEEFSVEIKKFDKNVAFIALPTALIERYLILQNKEDFLYMINLTKEIYNTEEEYNNFMQNLFTNAKIIDNKTIENFILELYPNMTEFDTVEKAKERRRIAANAESLSEGLMQVAGYI